MSPEEHNDLMGRTEVRLMGTKVDIKAIRSALDLEIPTFHANII